MGANTLGLLFFSISIALINQCNAGSMKVDGIFKVETKGEDISLIGKIYAHRKEPVHPALSSDECPEGLRGPPSDKGDQANSGREGPRGIPGDDGDQGDKGEAGEPGYCSPDCSETSPGEKGDQGDKGVRGTPGFPGRMGSKGDRGQKGKPGEIGDIGTPGIPGYPGDKGDQGPPGYFGYKGLIGEVGINSYSMKGAMGLKGDKGLPGYRGPPGLPGLPCDCANDDSAEADELCTKNPAYSESGYYIHNSKDEFEAYCNMTTKTACILSAKNTTRPVIYSGTLMSFWLSMVDDDYKVQGIYGISKNNIEWLQKRSTSVSLTLRYHCLNSKPNPTDSTKALKLLTWNDVVIGPTPTDTTPFYYTIPSETDGCKDSDESKWRYTDIVLSTNYVKRLPIKDYFISDLRDDEEQIFYIELISLCFK